MGLDELLSEDGVHPKSIKAANDKLKNEDVCPSCGSSDIEDGITFDNCKNDDCDVIMFNRPEYELDLYKIWG